MRNRTFYDADGITVRDSVASDVIVMQDRLRQIDVDEIWASNRHTPQEALSASLSISIECLTVVKGGVPVAMFGIAPTEIMGKTASIWLLGTNELTDIQFRFLRHSRRFIRLFLESYPTLYNWVDARNTVSIEWLKWCGAEVMDAAPYGPDKLPFHLFVIKREGYHV